MPAFLIAFVGWALASALPRILLGAGLAIGTYAALSPLLDNAINQVAAMLGGLAGEMAAILWIAGAGEALSIIASALVARMAVQAAMIFIGRQQAS